MRKLQIALSKREKVDRVCANLDQLRSKGEIGEAEYDAMMPKYSLVRESIKQELDAIHNELVEQKANVDLEAENVRTELKNIGLRHKVGEIDLQTFQNKMSKLERLLAKTEQRANEISRLMQARTAADVGGYIDVDFDRSSDSILDKLKDIRLDALGDSFHNIKSAISNWIKTSDTTDRMQLLGIVGGVLMALGVFWRFVRIDAQIVSFGYSLSSVELELTRALRGFGVSGNDVAEALPFYVTNAWWIILLLAVAGIVSFFVMEKRLVKPAMLVSGGLTALALLVAFIWGSLELASYGSELKMYGADFGYFSLLGWLSYGFYAIFGGAIMCVIAGLKYKNRI